MPPVPERMESENQPVEWKVGVPYDKHVAMGRPNLLSQVVGDTVLDALRKGISIRGAAGLAGLGEGTIRSWRDLGDAQPDGPYGDFARAFKVAQGLHMEREMVQILGGVDKWQAAAWSLERSYPDDYALKKDNSPISGATFIYAAEPPPKNEDLPPEALEE